MNTDKNEETKKQPTCEERIDERMKSRLASVLPDFDKYTKKQLIAYLKDYGVAYRFEDPVECLRDKARECFQDHMHEMLLSIDVTTTYSLCFSYGGPADYIKLHFDKDGDCIGGHYVFQDWFDGARRSISTEVAEQIADVFCIGPNYEK